MKNADILAVLSRIEELEGFIRDFAATTFNAMPRQFVADPHKVSRVAVLAWQDKAQDLLKGAKP